MVYNLDANTNTLNYTNLQEGTQYYWYVETISSTNTVLATSPIWSFTALTNTGNTQPVTNPTPNDGATNVTLDGNLSFTAGANTPTDATYILYFDTNTNPTTQFDLSSQITYSYSNLQENTTYYWYVETISSTNTVLATSPIWSFTTENNNGTVTDIDGNVYQTIVIGNQEWMAENLRVTKYHDGTSIPLITSLSNWASLGSNDGAYCYYQNDSSNLQIYGALYNFAGATNGNSGSNIQGICPNGWHLPSDDEWKILETYLGMDVTELDNNGWRGADEGGKLKSTSNYWNNPNNGATNTSGFTAQPTGTRRYDGIFLNQGYNSIFWTSDGYYRFLSNSNSKINREPIDYTNQGFCVRCLKD